MCVCGAVGVRYSSVTRTLYVLIKEVLKGKKSLTCLPLSHLFICRRYEQQVRSTWPSSCSSSSPAVSASSASSWRCLPRRLLSRRRPASPRPVRKKKSSVKSWRRWRGERKRRWGHFIIFIVITRLSLCSHLFHIDYFSIWSYLQYVSVMSSGLARAQSPAEGHFSSHIGWITLNCYGGFAWNLFVPILWLCWSTDFDQFLWLRQRDWYLIQHCGAAHSPSISLYNMEPCSHIW